MFISTSRLYVTCKGVLWFSERFQVLVSDNNENKLNIECYTNRDTSEKL